MTKISDNETSKKTKVICFIYYVRDNPSIKLNDAYVLAVPQSTVESRHCYKAQLEQL